MLTNATRATGQPSTDVALTSIALAEAIEDPSEIADALNQFAVAAGGRTPMLSAILLRAAVDVARAADRPYRAGIALANLAMAAVRTSLGEGDALLDETAEEFRKAGKYGLSSSAVSANRAMIAFASGAWDLAEELIGTSDTSPMIPVIINICAAVDGALAYARGRPRGIAVPEEVRAINVAGELSYSAMSDMYDALLAGDLRQAMVHGVDAVEKQVSVHGLWDDAIHFWPPAVECALAADDAGPRSITWSASSR